MAGWIGRTLSKIVIKQQLGQGGMAEVYLGQHTTLDRPVAVKVLRSFLLKDEKAIQRFRLEAQSVAAMRHPNIVQLFDFDVVDGQPYLAMELLQGLPLDSYLHAQQERKQTIPPETTVRILLSLASALDYAHDQGIVHRDIKPGNIFLRRESGPILLDEQIPLDVDPILVDFGVARLAQTAKLSTAGTITGTPAYLSPEQARGIQVNAQSDIYSLAVVVYEMLSGRLPFDVPEETPFAYILKHVMEPPIPLKDYKPEIWAVLERGLAKDCQARYEKASDMALALMSAVFGSKNLPSRSSGMPVDGLLNALNDLVGQAEAYELSLPANQYAARAVALTLRELARTARNEASDLAASLQPALPGQHPFSKREYEVLGLVAQGMTNKEIAYRLGISERTIEYHVNSIFNKTGAQTRMEAVTLAMGRGWIVLPGHTAG